MDRFAQKVDRLSSNELFEEVRRQASRLGMTVPQGHPHAGKQGGPESLKEGWKQVQRRGRPAAEQPPASAAPAPWSKPKPKRQSAKNARPLLQGLRLAPGQFTAPERAALTGLQPGVCLAEHEQAATHIWRAHRRDTVSQALVLPAQPTWERAVYQEATVQLEADDMQVHPPRVVQLSTLPTWFR
eukprot:2657240-Amphidinium_carterae.3